MAMSCNHVCSEIKHSDGLFQYGVQICGEDRRLKSIQKERLIHMNDTECYSLRLFSKSLKTAVGHNIPYAKITIDGKTLGRFVLNEPMIEIDRFPTNGDILCFTVCHTEEHTRRPRQTPAFQNINEKHMGLVVVEFGFCRDTQFPGLGEEAFVKLETDELPEALKISSNDIEPILATLNVRRGGIDEPDCGLKRIQTVEGGTLRVGNQNTTAMVDRMFTTCGIRNPMLSATIALRLVGTSPSSQRPRRRNDFAVKGIEGNILHKDCHSFSLPPTADIILI